MSVNFKAATVDAAQEIATAPHIWIGAPVEIAANTWVRVPTAPDATTAIMERGTSVDDIMDELNIWHAVQFYNEDEIPIKQYGAYTGEVEHVKTLLVRSGGMQSFLSFFPPSGTTVWLRSFTEYETVSASDNPANESRIVNSVAPFEMATDTDGKRIVKTPSGAPSSDDPFRFLGTDNRDRPFVVGPFLRSTSVWIYSSSAISVGWVTVPGSNRGINAIIS